MTKLTKISDDIVEDIDDSWLCAAAFLWHGRKVSVYIEISPEIFKFLTEVSTPSTELPEVDESSNNSSLQKEKKWVCRLEHSKIRLQWKNQNLYVYYLKIKKIYLFAWW